MASVAELEQRVADLESLVRGEQGALDYRALPQGDLVKLLEAINEPTEGRHTLGERTVTHREHGIVPYCRLKHTATQLIPNAVHTRLEFNTVVYNQGDMTAANAHRITFRVPGVYVVHASVAWNDLPAAPLYKIAILLNSGGVYVNTKELNADEKVFPANSVQSHNCTTIRHFDANDHVEAWVYQGTGGPWSTYTDGAINERYPSFSAVWVGNYE